MFLDPFILRRRRNSEGERGKDFVCGGRVKYLADGKEGIWTGGKYSENRMKNGEEKRGKYLEKEINLSTRRQRIERGIFGDGDEKIVADIG